MIGLDTNVLLRFYVDDNAEQAAIARKVMEGLTDDEPGYVSIVTLVELIWALRSRYRIKGQRIADIVSALLDTRDVIVEDETLVQSALDEANQRKLDLPDILIALRNVEAGCRHTVTFDKAAARAVPGMELLS